MRALGLVLGTFFGTGFFPVAPATFASLVFALVYAFVPGGHWLVHPAVVVVTLVVSVPATAALERDHGEDPGCAVLDEVVGMQVALVGAAPTLAGVAAAFLLFRVFDIVKLEPANRSQRLPGGWGIVADDFVAGVYTRVALVLAAAAWPALGGFGWGG